MDIHTCPSDAAPAGAAVEVVMEPGNEPISCKPAGVVMMELVGAEFIMLSDTGTVTAASDTWRFCKFCNPWSPEISTIINKIKSDQAVR